MAVRDFDGVDDRIGLAGVDLEIAAGAFSIVAVVKPTSLGAGEAFVGLRSGGALVASLADAGGFDNKLGLFTDSLGVTAAAGITAGDWQILALTKAAGTTAVRFHRKQLGAGTWTHVSTGGTHPDLAGIVDGIVLGGFSASSSAGVKAGRMAVAAVYDSELSDSDIEAIQTLATTQILVDMDAVSVWELTQALTATPVADLVSDADQTTIVGTSVVTGDDPPGWTFGATVVPPLEFSYRLSGGASNSNPAVSIGGAESATTAGIALFDNVTNSERLAGIVDYRLVYVHNDDADDGSAVAWVQANLEAGRGLAIGVATQAAGVTVPAVTDDRTAPAGVTFSSPATLGSGLSLGTIPAGSFRGLWIRRTVNSGTAVDPTNVGRVQIQTLRTE